MLYRPPPLVSRNSVIRTPFPGLILSAAHLLRRGILAHNLLDAPLVLHAVPLEHVVRLGLGGRLRVGVVEQVLDAQEDLLDRDGRLPRLLLVQDRKADGAGRVDVWVE